MNIQEYFESKEPALNGLHVTKEGVSGYILFDSPSSDDPYAPWHTISKETLKNTFPVSKKSSITLTYKYKHESYDGKGEKWEKDKDKVFTATIKINTKKGAVTIDIKDDPNLNVEDLIRSCAYLEKIANIYGKEALNLGPAPTSRDVMKIIETYPLTASEKAQAARALNKENERLERIDTKAELKYKKQVLNLTKKQSDLQKELGDTKRMATYLKSPKSREWQEVEYACCGY